MKATGKQLIFVCLLLTFPAACEEAQLSDLEKEAKEAVEQAKVRAKQWGQLSEEEIQKLWAIEYKSIRVTDTHLATLDEKLNELGQERWECYHVSEDEQGRVLFLKRRGTNTLRYVSDLLRLGALAF